MCAFRCFQHLSCTAVSICAAALQKVSKSTLGAKLKGLKLCSCSFSHQSISLYFVGSDRHEEEVLSAEMNPCARFGTDFAPYVLPGTTLPFIWAVTKEELIVNYILAYNL